MNANDTRTRLIEFDILRISAIFAVVFLHITAEGWWVDCPTIDWEIRNVYDSAVRWSVPIFVMISGALFLNPSKKITIEKLYRKNILRIILAYLLWATIYQLYELRNSDFAIKEFVFGIINGCYHLWFLKMLIGLYIAIPILRIVVSNKQIEQYFLIVALFTSSILPFLIHMTGGVSHELQEVLQTNYEKLSIDTAAGFSGYFVLGHYLSTYGIDKRYKNIIIIGAFACYLTVVILTSLKFHLSGVMTESFYGYLTPFTLIEAFAIFSIVTIRKHPKLSEKCKTRIVKISNLCFGIYLVHILVIRILSDYLGLASTCFNASISVPLFAVLVFTISCGVTWILRKIPYSKYFL